LVKESGAQRNLLAVLLAVCVLDETQTGRQRRLANARRVLLVTEAP